MKKILLTKNNYKEFISKDESQICMQDNMILTPGAKDEIRRSKIDIVYGEMKNDDKREDNSSSTQETISNIKDILKKDFNISDEEKVEKVCNLVLNKLNKK
ncbi:MAG: hypothetical protein ACTHVE_04600 [Senegalia sp. (in: firmicutes)]|uniref:hypothetical protein n=1 Tax=Senegalia sp. (in: firmicutes) TaxID=1924098 RepID=UPI003F976B88